MDCRKSQLLLSAYLDGELPSEQRIELDVHLEGCRNCRKNLTDIHQLSQAIRKLPVLRPPHDLWDRITTALDEERPSRRKRTKVVSLTRSSDEGVASSPVSRKLLLGSLAVASTLLIGLAVLWWDQQRHHDAREHDPLARYAMEFASDPVLAQRKLTAQYSGQAISADRATQLVGYRPVNVQPPPDGFKLDAIYLLDMPCCTCIEVFWKRNDDSYIAIFEHTTKPKEWFQSFPSVQIPCEGQTCRVIEVGDQLAASWRRGRRTLTVIGLRDNQELAKLVATLL